jgi:hypothetical protein
MQPSCYAATKQGFQATEAIPVFRAPSAPARVLTWPRTEYSPARRPCATRSVVTIFRGQCRPAAAGLDAASGPGGWLMISSASTRTYS